MFDTNEMFSTNYLAGKYSNYTLKPIYNNNFPKVLENANIIEL